MVLRIINPLLLTVNVIHKVIKKKGKNCRKRIANFNQKKEKKTTVYKMILFI